MRVRIRRFEELRLARNQSRQTKRLEIPARQGNVERVLRGHVPPTAPEPSGPSTHDVTLHAMAVKLAVHRPPPLPLAQHQHAQMVMRQMESHSDSVEFVIPSERQRVEESQAS